MNYTYSPPRIKVIQITIEGEITATSSIVLPGDSNNLVEVEDWDNDQELNDTLSW